MCFLIVFCFVPVRNSVVIEVSECDSSECSSGYCRSTTTSTHFLCSSLNQLSTFISNNSNQMKFSNKVNIFVNCTGTHCSLSELITFEKIRNLHIYGDNEASTVHCDVSKEKDTGLAFKNASNLFVSNLTFIGCGGLHNSTSQNVSNGKDVLKFKSALYFECCENISVLNITIKNSSGVGLVFYDTIGLIYIQYCTFNSNIVPSLSDDQLPGGGGVYIEFTPCRPGMYSNKCTPNSQQERAYNKTGGQYVIQGCRFAHNIAHSLRSYFKQTAFRTFGQGGGLLISLRGNASRNSFLLKNCSFVNNSALWGGGLHLLLMDSSMNNTINVSNTLFKGNSAKDGGGALAIYISSATKRSTAPLSNNLILFEGCNFSENQASHGGGMIIFVSIGYSSDHASNKLEFYNTNWTANSAKSSAAVDITARDASSVVQGPYPTFINCLFYYNMVHSITKPLDHSSAIQSSIGKASFLVTLSKVFFNNSVEFYRNNITALHVSAGVASFSGKMTAKFENNYGIRGGAISLIASSYLEVRRNSSFNFISNYAFVRGGAIYSYSIGEHELHDHIFSLGCFIQYINENQGNADEHNVNIIFTNNDVTTSSYNHGRSIFSTSLLACASNCHGDFSVLNASTALSCVANFTFVNSSAESQVSMPGSKFSVPNSIPSKVIPGKRFHFQISILDGFNNSENAILRSYVKPTNNSRIAVDSANSYIADNTLIIYGSPGAKGKIHLEKVDYHIVDLSFDIEVIQCPPGYILFTPNTEKMTDQCVCAWSTHIYYYGILKCNHSHFQAYITHGLWAGYASETESEDNLYTAYCPFDFCMYHESYFFLLPGEANRTKLSEYICSKKRTGWLCGSCVDDYSTYFHSPNYKCGHNKDCGFGLLLYIISEIIPLTLFFTAIMLLRINFTSGRLTGLIFFAQVIDALLLDTYSLIGRITYSSHWLHIINWLLLFIYRVLNLNFFTVNSLSFCLWKGATTLDIIAFKYVTIAFAFVLVLATYMVMNCCNFYHRCKCCKLCRHLSVQSSIIHSISTFLVMCFAQCVQTSFLLLTPGHIYGKGGKLVDSRLLYHGDTPMFSVQHALYATPAFLCILMLVFLPTIVLLWYPLGPRLLTLCGLGDSILLNFINKMLPLHKLKPFFDSFQSCFKDDLRFFSGLYFSYRISLIAAYTFSFGLTQFFTIVEILLVTMLMLHALAQPYKKRWHNVTDTLIFSNLTIINALSLFIYLKSTEKLYREVVVAMIYIQMFLISLPLTVMFLLTIFHVVIKLKRSDFYKNLKCRKSRSGSIDDYKNVFPARLIDSDDSDSDRSTDYNLFDD